MRAFFDRPRWIRAVVVLTVVVGALIATGQARADGLLDPGSTVAVATTTAQDPVTQVQETVTTTTDGRASAADAVEQTVATVTEPVGQTIEPVTETVLQTSDTILETTDNVLAEVGGVVTRATTSIEEPDTSTTLRGRLVPQVRAQPAVNAESQPIRATAPVATTPVERLAMSPPHAVRPDPVHRPRSEPAVRGPGLTPTMVGSLPAAASPSPAAGRSRAVPPPPRRVPWPPSVVTGASAATTATPLVFFAVLLALVVLVTQAPSRRLRAPRLQAPRGRPAHALERPG